MAHPMVDPNPTTRWDSYSRPTFSLYQRDEDESVGVAAFGNKVRVHFAVAGLWPDGSTDYR